MTSRTPTGTTSARWFTEGYQAALKDIRDQYVAGGQDAMLEWLKNNLQDG